MRNLLPAALAALLFLLVPACGGDDSSAPPAPAPADDRTPVAATLAAGGGQSATAGTAVDVRPAVRVTDRAGRGVAGMTVNFEVASGGGDASGTSQVTNSDGVAIVGGWTLGSVGPQQLVARSPGLPAVTFDATATAPAGLPQMEAVAGTNGQTGNAGAAIANAPAVQLRDASGTAAVGVNVTFAVAGGGGSVLNSAVATDGNGVASAGRWMLGPDEGEQRVTASAAGYLAITFVATALAAADPAITRTTVVSGLSNPWDIAFTPDGWMLFTERGRGLSARSADGTVTRRLFGAAGALRVADDFIAEDQSGMLGVAIDPEFATRRFVYVFMASTLPSPTLQPGTNNRVVRLAVNAEYTAITERVDIVSGISYADGAHSGGRIRFGPDGYLYITTGDNRIGEIPQDLRVLGGKVLRVDRDGGAAPGNRTAAGGDPRLYTYGHRNVQGIDFRPPGFPGAGRAYTGEHGPGHDDEVTPLAAGGNGGWDPLCRPEGNGYCGYSRPTPMTDLARFPDAMPPLWQTGGFDGRPGRSEGMADVAFLSGERWRSWDGALAVALLAGMRIEILRLDAAGTALVGRTALFTNLAPRVRIRALELGPDGALYSTTDTGEIWRIAPG